MKLESILRRAHFTPDEVKLSVEIERIIFNINLHIHAGEKRADATFSDVQSGLHHVGVELPDEKVLDTMRKLQWVEIEGEKVAFPVLEEIHGKWRSNV